MRGIFTVFIVTSTALTCIGQIQKDTPPSDPGSLFATKVVQVIATEPTGFASIDDVNHVSMVKIDAFTTSKVIPDRSVTYSKEAKDEDDAKKSFGFFKDGLSKSLDNEFLSWEIDLDVFFDRAIQESQCWVSRDGRGVAVQLSRSGKNVNVTVFRGKHDKASSQAPFFPLTKNGFQKLLESMWRDMRQLVKLPDPDASADQYLRESKARWSTFLARYPIHHKEEACDSLPSIKSYDAALRVVNSVGSPLADTAKPLNGMADYAKLSRQWAWQVANRPLITYRCALIQTNSNEFSWMLSSYIKKMSR